jgi:uncharacterized protein Yka (UPF0111/DUF47 family)
MWWSGKKKSFFNDFESHSQEIRKAAITLKQLFEGSIPKEEASHKIKEYEHEADNITHEVIKQLCVANFIPPLDHQDIIGFINALDDVIDYIDDCVEAFVEIYELQTATSYAQRFSEEILKGTALLIQLCPLLRQPARNSALIQRICTEIHQIETEGDNIKKEALKDLFRHYTGSKLDIAWDRIYEFLEMATDKVEDCANIAEQILMKYS